MESDEFSPLKPEVHLPLQNLVVNVIEMTGVTDGLDGQPITEYNLSYEPNRDE